MAATILDLSAIDKTVSPADDFYHYAAGGWIKQTPIPPDKPEWNFFYERGEKTLDELRWIMEKAQTNKQAKSEEYKIGTFYTLGMDEEQIEKEGLKPLQAEFDRISQIKDDIDLIRTIAHMHLCSAGPFFDFGPAHDPENSNRMIANLWQGGLSLPDRSYYLDGKFNAIRGKYKKHLERMFVLMGDDRAQAGKNAEIVLRLESKLALASMDKVSLRDPHKTFHKMTTAQLRTLAPTVPWDKYFRSLGLTNITGLNVGQPEFFKALDSLLENTPLTEIKTYLRWQLVNALAPFLSKEFVAADFDFYKKNFLGLQEQPPRWKRMVSTVNSLLGDAVGKVYVREHFPAASKKKMLVIVKNLIAATGQRLKRLDWMEESTKKEALKKLALMRHKIGFPDKWIDYSKLEIKNDGFIANILRANYFNSRRDLREIGRPTDRLKWQMPPQTVNAYFSPPDNEIVFPAAILQPVMFDPKADDAVNYGAIGSVIAHEITHSFDDQGRKYDAKGNLRDWWTAADAKRFAERAKVLVEQFSGYVAIDRQHINGELTLGENIADLGGLSIAFDALQYSLKNKPRKLIGGLTPEQRFYFSYARVWRSNTRPEYLKLRLNTDPHSPAQFRVNGPLSNLPTFAKAFKIPAGSPMARLLSRRAQIW